MSHDKESRTPASQSHEPNGSGRTSDNPSLAFLVDFFKVLADETRLLIIGLLTEGEKTVGELADLLDVRGPTVSHHLSRLRGLGLVNLRVDGTSHYYSLNTSRLAEMAAGVLRRDSLAEAARRVSESTYGPKVLSNYFDEYGRLFTIPAQRKKRLVVLRHLAQQFEPGLKYYVTEVNEIIGRIHPDFATLRRELVGYDLLRRKEGCYWKPQGETEADGDS